MAVVEDPFTNKLLLELLLDGVKSENGVLDALLSGSEWFS